MHQHGGDIYRNKVELDFSSNINLMGMPDSVMEAAKAGVEQSWCYPDIMCDALRHGISEKEEISKDMIICGNGAADLIFSLVHTIKPRHALMVSPTFQAYEQALVSAGCKCHYYPLQAQSGYELLPQFWERITDDIDMVFVCNPNNPTGTLVAKEQLTQVLKRCEACNCMLVVDECFLDFVEDSHRYTVKELCRSHKHLFVLRAFTKLYAMPGLRLGYGYCSDFAVLHNMFEISQPWNVSVPAQMAGIAALKETAWVKESLAVMREEKAWLIQNLTDMGCEIYGSKANYIFFKSEEGLYEHCLNERILIRDCSNYRELAKGHYRIVVKTRGENERLIEVIKRRRV